MKWIDIALEAVNWWWFVFAATIATLGAIATFFYLVWLRWRDLQYKRFLYEEHRTFTRKQIQNMFGVQGGNLFLAQAIREGKVVPIAGTEDTYRSVLDS